MGISYIFVTYFLLKSSLIREYNLYDTDSYKFLQLCSIAMVCMISLVYAWKESLIL